MKYKLPPKLKIKMEDGNTLVDEVNYENILAFQLDGIGIRYERQYKFYRDRKWRADFYVHPMILIEVQGVVDPGSSKRLSGHTTIAGYTRDLERLDTAQLLGYTMLWFTQRHVLSGYAYTTIEKMVEIKRDREIN